MSILPIGSSASSVSSVLLQRLFSGTGGDSTAALGAGSGGDSVAISSAGSQLSQAPPEVTKALNDLCTQQADVQSDLSQLKAYFKDKPETLSGILASMQNGTGTYNASGVVANGTDADNLMAALLQAQSQDPMLASQVSTGDSGLFSLMG
nr:hypothetical protein [uncultured Holophaga sp.]